MLKRKKAKKMIKQLMSADIKDYLKPNSKIILLDVRTEGEWEGYGKPDGEKLGLKTYFLTIKDENLLNEFEDLLIIHTPEFTIMLSQESFKKRSDYDHFVETLWEVATRARHFDEEE